MFIGREVEIKKLNQLYETEGFQCAVIYGRRRVGKTTLINEFCKDKKSIYFKAIETTVRNNLDNFSRSIFSVTGQGAELTADLEGVEDIFEYLYGFVKNERIILVIDEYHYLSKTEKTLSSVLQTFIDQKFKNSKLFLIICSSSMPSMEANIFDRKSPLYGRWTLRFKLLPFDYYNSALFCPGYSPEDKALVYGITGGIPQYLERINPQLTIRENIINNFFDDNGCFYEEPHTLLRQDLRDLHMYNAIITSIACGTFNRNKIANGVGLIPSAGSTYMNTLMTLGFLEKELSIADVDMKKPVYKVSDNMLRFWYQFVANNVSIIGDGKGTQVYEQLFEPYLNEYMSRVFEDIALQYLRRCNRRKELPFVFSIIGRWWKSLPDANVREGVSIVAASNDERKAIFCKCRYQDTPVGEDALNSLIEDSKTMEYYKDKYYILFSKSGFSGKLEIPGVNVKLVDLSAMYEPRLRKGVAHSN